VTVYASALAPDTTSNIAGGQWSPTSVFEEGRATSAFEAQFKDAARIAHRMFGRLVGAGYGVSWRENYFLNDAPTSPANTYYLRELPELFPALAVLGRDDHPFPSPHVLRFVTMLIEPGIFLRRLTAEIRLAGGRFVVRTFQDRAEVLALTEPVIFNCTGLGAGALFGGGSGLLYMFPRSDGILLGGTYERGASHLTPDADTTRRIVSEHARMAAAMRL
jgi:hypothetical protein